MNELVVTSHVGRDLLQAAQHFKTDRTVVWEYVANSLQYTDPGVPPEVVVSLDEKAKALTIVDNGRGMNREDLQHFFKLHAENRERAAGRIGRGMFGTGKSAAFGIADELTVTSVRDGMRTKVQLHRDDILSMADGAPIPVKVLESEVKTGQPNGTVVEIRGIHLRRIDRSGIISYIERNLNHYPRDVSVFVDHHECQFVQPDIAEETVHRPDGELARTLGDVALVVRVAKGPLSEELRGIQIFSHGNWHETTLAGAENKQMSEFLFGEIDIPALEEYDGPIAPYDNTRSGRLNPSNELVAALYRFIGPIVDSTRRELVKRERERARSEESKRLAKSAAQISEVLSEDFAAFRRQLRRVTSAVGGKDVGKKFQPLAGDDEEGPWSEGGEQLASPVPTDPADQRSRPEAEATSKPPPEFQPPVLPDEAGTTSGGPTGSSETAKARTPRGGLRIVYQNLGESQPRGKYVLDKRTIIINLDHPQVAAAYAVDRASDSTFLRLTAEIATSEYAVALATELTETYTIADEAIFDIHDTIDRVSRRFADLYSDA